MSQKDQAIYLYVNPAQDCSYLPGQQSTSLFVDPRFKKDKSLQTFFSEQGFRRSGAELYRPDCEHCSACIATRLSVTNFKPKRNQTRCWRQNQDLTINVLPARFKTEHFQLYQRYLASRHSGGGMDDPTPESYLQFLNSDWSETQFIEFRLKQDLVAIAVIDQLEDAISAVYTFFEPELKSRSLGRFAILYQIELARRQGLQWLYLGYMIKDCQKMQYKQDYQPQQHFIDGKWKSC